MRPVLDGDLARDRVQASAELNRSIRLNDGQMAAAELILASADRTVAVEGVAGAGKSSVLAPVADVLREEGREVLGLAVQNTLVQMLQRETGIESMTVARFLKAHEAVLAPTPDAKVLAVVRTALGGAAIRVD